MLLGGIISLKKTLLKGPNHFKMSFKYSMWPILKTLSTGRFHLAKLLHCCWSLGYILYPIKFILFKNTAGVWGIWMEKRKSWTWNFVVPWEILSWSTWAGINGCSGTEGAASRGLKDFKDWLQIPTLSPWRTLNKMYSKTGWGRTNPLLPSRGICPDCPESIPDPVY